MQPFGGELSGIVIAHLDGAVERDFDSVFWAADGPWVAAGQPVVGGFVLPVVLE